MSFLFQWVYLLSLSLWLGSVVFFSFFTTPAAFSSLPREMTSAFLSGIFPSYYVLGYACSGGLLLGTIWESLKLQQLPWLRLFLILVMAGANLYAGLVLQPQLHQLKVQMQTLEEGSEIHTQTKAKFSTGHRFSVILNLIVLVAGLSLIGIVAFRLRI